MKRLMLLVLLSGCAATEAPRYAGRPVSDVVSRIGLPSSERVVMGQTVYTWTNTGQVSTMAPVLGGGSRLVLVPVATSGTCSLQVAVDAAQLVTRMDTVGDNGLCADYLKRLR